jgi:hypothetical protein
MKLLLILFLAAAASASAAPALAHEKHDSGVTGVLGLDVFASGDTVDVLLAVQEKGAPGVALRHVRSTDGGRTWGKATPILPGAARVAPPRRGDDPQIAASDGGRLVVLWTEPGSSPWGTGPLGSAVSSDGGRTWVKGARPADDGSTDAHGFVDIAALGPDRFLAVWLDSRDGGQGLRSAATSDGGKTWKKNVDVDARTCECCANRLLVREDGKRVDVIYRARNPRDMVVATTSDGGATWVKRGPTARFAWEFDGCPEVGGALAATTSEGRERLHALAWTGKESDVGVWTLVSSDSGASWSAPKRLGDASAKHLDMASSGACLAAAWDEYRPAGKGYAIQAATSCDGSTSWSKPQTLSEPGASATHPLAAATRNGVIVAWTERKGTGAVAWKSHLLPLPPPSKSAAR